MDVFSRTTHMTIDRINVEKAISEAKDLMEKEELSPAMKSAFSVILLLVEILANRMRLNSKNSSTPPSQDPNRGKTPKEKSDKSRGGQRGHVGSTLEQVEDPDKVEDIPVDRKTLPKGDWKRAGYESRQVFDITISTVVTEYRAEILINEHGEKRTASFPDGVISPTQYGNSVKAHAVYLSKQQLVPYKRIQEYFTDQLGLPLSAGTISNFNLKAYATLDWYPDFIRQRLFESNVLHVDETGININGKGKWVHVHTTPIWTLLVPHSKRGKEAMDAIGVLPSYKGTLVHDHWKPYYRYLNMVHALCNAHHLRELEWAYTEDQQAWAKRMQELLVVTCQEKKDAGGSIPPERAAEWIEKYRHIIREGERECPPPTQLTGAKKRGRLKRSKSRNLLERLRNFEEDTLRFMESADVGFTNNEAERALRMTKVHQKISGCFRSFEGADVYCRIRSYLSSAMKQGFTASYALNAIFEGRNIFLEK